MGTKLCPGSRMRRGRSCAPGSSFIGTAGSTHGVNCTGGCTWQIYVKDGIVTWEMQGLDYPTLEAGLPPYEPRGCQRGISYSWYLYSPLRVKYPYLRSGE